MCLDSLRGVVELQNVFESKASKGEAGWGRSDSRLSTLMIRETGSAQKARGSAKGLSSLPWCWFPATASQGTKPGPPTLGGPSPQFASEDSLCPAFPSSSLAEMQLILLFDIYSSFETKLWEGDTATFKVLIITD